MSSVVERATYGSMIMHEFITRPLNAGKQSEESKKAESEEEREIERTTVGVIYDSSGRNIENSRSRINAENYQEYLKQHKKKYEPIDTSA